MAAIVPKLSSGGAVRIRFNSIDLGTTRWKEGTFEILEKDNKINLCIRFNCGGAPKTFQLNQNVKQISQSLNRIMLTLKDTSVITLDKMPPTLTQKTKEYLEKLKQGKQILKTSHGSASFSVLGNRSVKNEANPSGERQAHPTYSGEDDGPSTSSSHRRLTQKTLDFRPPLTETWKRAITASIADFIALDMRPVNIIEGAGFKKLMETLEPGYTVPKRDTVMHAVMAKYDTMREVVMEQIKDSAAVSFTTDIWTSQQMEAYMTVTAHFITNDWRLESFVLETKEMGESHTAANIAQRLSEVMDAYEIPGEKRVAVVHDNAANMILCSDMLTGDPSWGTVQGVRCAGHTLQLCINAALKEDPVCHTIAAARRLVGHFKKSAKATAALKEKQLLQKVAEHKLTQDVATRWNSTFYMLERLVEQRWPVTAVLSDPGTSKRADRDFDLTTAQWRIAEDIVSVLKPMVTLTELLSQDINASLSATLPMIINMKTRHLQVREDESAATKALKGKLTAEFDRRWELTGRLVQSSIYMQAAVLDPRFKKLSFLEDVQRDEAYETVADLAESLYIAQGPAQMEREDSSTETPPPPKKKKDDKEKEIAMLLMMSTEEEEEEGLSRIQNEMKMYLQDQTRDDAGPLNWWRKNDDRYPKLSTAAKRILCIPSTSTPLERIFSKAGFIVNKTRSSLLPSNVDKLVFLSHNMSRLNKNTA